MEAVKTAWEAFNSDMKTRLGLAIGLTTFLLCRNYIEALPGGNSLFSLNNSWTRSLARRWRFE